MEPPFLMRRDFAQPVRHFTQAPPPRPRQHYPIRGQQCQLTSNLFDGDPTASSESRNTTATRCDSATGRPYFGRTLGMPPWRHRNLDPCTASLTPHETNDHLDAIGFDNPFFALGIPVNGLARRSPAPGVIADCGQAVALLLKFMSDLRRLVCDDEEVSFDRLGECIPSGYKLGQFGVGKMVLIDAETTRFGGHHKRAPARESLPFPKSFAPLVLTETERRPPEPKVTSSNLVEDQERVLKIILSPVRAVWT